GYFHAELPLARRLRDFGQNRGKLEQRSNHACDSPTASEGECFPRGQPAGYYGALGQGRTPSELPARPRHRSDRAPGPGGGDRPPRTLGACGPPDVTGPRWGVGRLPAGPPSAEEVTPRVRRQLLAGGAEDRACHFAPTEHVWPGPGEAPKQANAGGVKTT